MANSLNNYQLIDETKNIGQTDCVTNFDKQAISIHKFGGSSLSSKKNLLNVTNIILDKTSNEDFVVVSANGKITDWLIAFTQGKADALTKIKDYYLGLVTVTLNSPLKFLNQFNQDVAQLEHEHLNDNEILAFGELWSAKLLVALLSQQNIPALFIDARDVLRTDTIETFARFDTDYFDQAIEKIIYGNYEKRLIITGFIAQNLNGETITLGRNGSDYTASILANLTHAKEVVLWTDVKGIYDADPNLIQAAQPIAYLSFYEAQTLASIGTNVLHNKTIAPLIERQIPLFVRSSIEPECIGTCISNSNSFYRESDNVFNKTKSIAIKQGLISLTLKNRNQFEHQTVLDRLSYAGIFHLKTAYNINTKYLTVLIEKNASYEVVNLLSQTNTEFILEKEDINLVALVGKNISYQKSFLLILQKILSIQYQFKIIHSDSSELFLICCEDKNVLGFFELVYHCCTSEEFCHQANLNFPYSLKENYSLFESNQLTASEVTQ